LHTFAQILIREFALECGYSAAGIAGRIYARSGEQPMAAAAGLAHKQTIAGSEQPPLSGAAGHHGRFLCRSHGDDHRTTPVQPPISRQHGTGWSQAGKRAQITSLM
jgi:hypothetical protein